MASSVLCIAFCTLCLVGVSQSWGSSKDKVLLKDINVITLEQGRMTNGRRSSPVEQLKCKSSGSAGCYSHTPRVVQCYNRGFDGHDVQWECKADMDTSVKFGRIQVSCEGYDYPDDRYILKGSCGLEYELDATGHGHHGDNGGHHHGDSYHHGGQNHYGGGYQHHRRSWLAENSWMMLAIVGVVVYALYRCQRMNGGDNDDSNASDRPQRPDTHTRGMPQQPPPSYDESCGQQSYQSRTRTAGGGGGMGGFFGGATAGGLLGYFLGSRNRTHYGQQYGHRHHQPYGTGYGSGWGSGWGSGGGWGSSGGSSWGGSSYRSSSSRSSGSRTTSGFGGTTRR